MQSVLLGLHVLFALGLVGLVLMQHGKGADAGAAFGSGASATVFGAQGSGNFMSRATGVLAALFFATSLSLAYLSGRGLESVSVTDTVIQLENAPATLDVPGLPEDVPFSGDAPISDIPN